MASRSFLSRWLSINVLDFLFDFSAVAILILSTCTIGHPLLERAV